LEKLRGVDVLPENRKKKLELHQVTKIFEKHEKRALRLLADGNSKKKY